MKKLLIILATISLTSFAETKPEYVYHRIQTSNYDKDNTGGKSKRHCRVVIKGSTSQGFEAIVQSDVVTSFGQTASKSRQINPNILAPIMAETADSIYLKWQSVDQLELPKNYRAVEYLLEKHWGEYKKTVRLIHEVKEFGKEKEIAPGSEKSASFAVDMWRLCENK